MVMRSHKILYVEDDGNDRRLMERAFAAEGASAWLHVVENGVEAMAWLRGDGDYEDRKRYPLPQMLLLDLALPRADGMAVLRWVREQPSLAELLVVVFSGSYQQEHIDAAYQLGANAFLRKPTGVAGLREVARLLRLWLRHGVPRPGPARKWEGAAVEDPPREDWPRGWERFPLHKPQGFRTWGEGR